MAVLLKMLVAIRVDASLAIGTGHVMRCLTLADALLKRGTRSIFICRPHVGHLISQIEERGHKVVALPTLSRAYEPPVASPTHAAWLGTDWKTDAAETQQELVDCMGNEPLDWLVVDHYALDYRWEKTLRTNARRIMVIDDLADRSHDCELLLDQNLGRDDQDYEGLVHSRTIKLIGPQFALLRPEFAELRSQSLVRRKQDSQLKHLLITMGGVDKDNATCHVLDAIKACALPSELRVTVVMGPHAPWLSQVQSQALQMPWLTDVLVGVNNMAQLMVDSDLAIGAAGSTSWERCCLGLPTLILVLADNQMAGAAALQNFGAAVVAERVDSVGALLSQIVMSDDYQKLLSRWSQSAATVTDGSGVDRVCKHLMVGHA